MYKKDSRTTKWRNKKKEEERKKTVKDCPKLEEMWKKKRGPPDDDPTIDPNLDFNNLSDLEPEVYVDELLMGDSVRTSKFKKETENKLPKV